MCWRLVNRVVVGRVGFVYDDEPMVLPVNCVVVDGNIAFRTAGDSMLHNLGEGARVAFEADHVDPVAESGWSVLVRGNLWELNDEALASTVGRGQVAPVGTRRHRPLDGHRAVSCQRAIDHPPRVTFESSQLSVATSCRRAASR